jgi:hypothetical protein
VNNVVRPEAPTGACKSDRRWGAMPHFYARSRTPVLLYFPSVPFYNFMYWEMYAVPSGLHV